MQKPGEQVMARIMLPERRMRKAVAVGFALAAAACAGTVGTSGPGGDDDSAGDAVVTDGGPDQEKETRVLPAPPPPVVVSAEDRGFLSKPATALGRDGGMAAVIGGQLVWVFGDTLLTVAAQDTGLTLRSSTAARGPAGPWTAASNALDEPLDGSGAPFEAIPFSADELAFNAANFPANGRRVANWVSAVFAAPGAGDGLVFFEKVDCDHASFQARGEMWIDRLHAPALVSEGQPTRLFGPGERTFRPSELSQDGWVYLVSAQLDFVTFVYSIARVPVAQVGERDAYRFWNGSDWVASQEGLAPLPGAVMGGNAASLTWNPHLGKYLLVSSTPTTIQLRVADSPVGEWSEPVEVSQGVAPPYAGATFGNYAGHEQPALRSADGKTIAVSYFNPTGEFDGHIRLITITLQ